MADQRPSEGGRWEGIPSPEEQGWAGWCVHWLTAHSPTALTQQVTELGLSPRSHGRHLWRHLTRRVTTLEADLDQEQVDGITGQALTARTEGAVEELAETREALRVLETIGPYLPGR